MPRLSSFGKNPRKLWELYAKSKQYGTAPSEQVGLQGTVEGYCLDRAVLMFGKALENEITEKTKGAKSDSQSRAKATRVFNDWMTPPGEEPKGLYRDPMAR